MRRFDHIVIGGGSAGCAAVARLIEGGGGTVCLIEAGPGDRDLRVRVPFGLVSLIGSRRDWRRRTLPQAALGGRRVAVPRGRMIGGSGSLNSMVWFRGCRADYDGWALPGWSATDVWADFDAVEARVGPRRLAGPHPLSTAFGALFPANDPAAPPTPERESAGVVHCNLHHGRRRSAADAFLRPAQTTGRVTVIAGAEVARITLAGGAATGVVLRTGEGIDARLGVVLCAGSIESPMILMRSGLGPGAMLRAAGIEVVRDMPGVGANLHDHPAIGLHFAGPGTGYGLTWAQLPVWAAAPVRYALSRWGRLASSTVEACAFFSTTGAGTPDVQSHFIPFMIGWQGRPITWGAGYFVDVCVCRPRSRGRLTLGADPWVPEIDLGLLSDPADLEVLVAGVERLRTLLDRADLGPRRGSERMPGAGVTSTALAAAIRARCGTAYHPVGTLRMGSDPAAPVTPDLRLRGIDRLWVADASVMPAVTSANTNAPSMLIGWRGGAAAARPETRRAA